MRASTLVLRRALGATALVVAAVGWPGWGQERGELAAQQGTRVESLETERRLDYQSATDAYEGALAARAAAETRFSRLAQDIDDARARGDDERRNQALAEAQRLTNTLLSLDQRVAETATQVERARARYLTILDVRLDLLAEQISFATTQTDSIQLGALYRDLRTRFAEVENDSRGAVALVPVVMPEISREPRDGPLELRVKAELLEKRAEQADSVIVYLDAELVDLERRAARERSVRELVRSVDRFGDTDVPVGPPRSGDEAQSDGVESAPEDRIESMRLLRTVYEERRDEARRRAAEFRRLAGGDSP